MSDVRARLAEALRKHRQGPGPSCRCCGVDYDAPTYTDHLADALLSLPSIAIVDFDDERSLEIARKAIEDELIEWRDDRLSSPMRNNGFVVKERDGKPSSIIRFGPEEGLRIGLKAIAAANAAESVTK